MQERCLQEITGSCLGCQILEMVVNRINKGQDIEKAADEIRKTYCPEGTRLQTHYIQNRRSAAMGQQKSSLVEARI